MKLNITIEGKQKEVLVTGLKGRHRQAFFKQVERIAKIAKNDNPEDVSELSAMMDFWKDLIIEVSDVTSEEWDEMYLEEQNKLIESVQSILMPFGNSTKDFL